MEILYLWVENYRDFITKQGFNFSCEFIFDYNYDNGELVVSKNQNYIDGFFSLDMKSKSHYINNITAIIGENGVGKSSLLELIKTLNYNYYNNKSIIIYKTDNKYFIRYSPRIKKPKVNSDLEGFSSSKCYIKKYEQLTAVGAGMPLVYGIRKIDDISFIFFSNTFDTMKYESPNKNIYDISTNFLLSNDKHERVKNKTFNPDYSQLEAHRLSEIRRQIKFLNSNTGRDKVGFNLPKSIEVSSVKLNLTKEDYNRFGRYYDFVKNIEKQIKKYQEEISNGIISDKKKKEYVIADFYRDIFINFFYDIIMNFKGDIINNDQINMSNLKGETILEKVKCFFESLLKSKLLSNDTDWIKNINKLINFLNNHKNVVDINVHGNLIFPFQLTDITNNIFNEFLYIYERAVRHVPFCDFSWRNLSSGEKALLNIYARFYSLVDKNLKDDLIILIDEGELYLHPNWQKKFLFNLIEFLPEIFDNKKIQIILTSHSPFVISDLPSYNIIFLKQNKNGKCMVVDGLKENNRTFGSNIHTLFSDSFFMKDGLTGDFAKYKINELIKLLLDSSDSQIEDKKHQIKKTINVIGEPVIRNKLLNILKERIEISHSEYIGVQDKIDNLQRQIDELKRKKNNDKD